MIMTFVGDSTKGRSFTRGSETKSPKNENFYLKKDGSLNNVFIP